LSPRRSKYRTGQDDLDRLIEELVELAGVEPDEDLVFEMVVSALRMGREAADRGELKLVSSALKELRYSFLVFEPYTHTHKVSIFGSARTPVDSPEYEAARYFGERIAKHGWMVITGAGPGILEAGIEGAGAENSFGVNILLPFESSAAPAIAGDEKLINFKYFFTRKLMFMKESDGFVLLPGGFGTMDEAFELLTLTQTGRMPLAPIVMLDTPGSTYWSTWREFIEQEHHARGLISDRDLQLFTVTDSVDEAVEEFVRFYRVYHSSRSVGRRLILRLNRPLSDDTMQTINEEFADIVESGKIERTDTTSSEREDNDHVDLPRIGFKFDRRSYSRLRELIDTING
jgi:uncharacterized protein (TIGR00730 family)